ncbi:Trp repressor/replication initiator [Moorella glycerini]|uniref:Transposase n=1 Tax=Neomoorella stamsii TaxID=1266720 RepID=A0A9X7P5P1_9FIRM|nr:MULTISPECIES: transposase [Moorella]PRR71727.1 Transposase [Moorella stamsii]CEP66895.1 Trp repressor/replication initiator [Moorella glycerini]CEP67230.1 Trp repressor/replication initiator [Moorella glycerini]
MSVRKKYPTDFKAKVVLEILKEEESISQLSSEYGIHPSILNRWRNMVVEKLSSFKKGLTVFINKVYDLKVATGLNYLLEKLLSF